MLEKKNQQQPKKEYTENLSLLWYQSVGKKFLQELCMFLLDYQISAPS